MADLDGTTNVELGDRLEATKYLAQPKGRLLGWPRYAIESPAAPRPRRSDNQVTAELICETARCFTEGVRPWAITGLARALRLPRDTLVTSLLKESFDVGSLKAIPRDIEEIEQANPAQRLRWERSDAAARLDALEDDFEPSVLPAADAALALVRFEFPTWARSEAAALLAAFDAELELNVFPAGDAARFPVCLERDIFVL